MKDFGPIISKIRSEKGLSQEELASLLGVTKQTISNYERGTRRPSYEALEAIADVLNVPIGYFLTKEEQEQKLRKIYKTYNITVPSPKKELISSNVLYVSRKSVDMKADEIRKYLHEVIDSLSDSDLEFFKDFTIRMKK